MRKYKPIKIFHFHYGYGYWWGSYFFFFGRQSACFAIVPMYMECNRTSYANKARKIGHGSVLSWSDSRQKEAYKK